MGINQNWIALRHAWLAEKLPNCVSLWMSLGFDFLLHITITIDAGCKKLANQTHQNKLHHDWLCWFPCMENWSMKHASRWRTILTNKIGCRAIGLILGLASWSCLKIWNKQKSMCSHHVSFIFPIKIQSLTFGGLFVHMETSKNGIHMTCLNLCIISGPVPCSHLVNADVLQGHPVAMLRTATTVLTAWPVPGICVFSQVLHRFTELPSGKLT